LRGIFKNPEPPREIWQKQFDGYDAELQRLGETPFEEIKSANLNLYFWDLAYQPLQPDLFSYLFPVCLMHWHRSLVEIDTCEFGFGEFYLGMRRGDIYNLMLDYPQQKAVCNVFADSFLERVDAESPDDGPSNRPFDDWLVCFNSLGMIMPRIDLLWDPWWNLETPGRARAALVYCSGLMYFDGENPLFPNNDNRNAAMLEHILNEDVGWLPENVAFLRSKLTLEFINSKAQQALEQLQSLPQFAQWQTLEKDLPDRQELMTERIQDLPQLLHDPKADRSIFGGRGY